MQALSAAEAVFGSVVQGVAVGVLAMSMVLAVVLLLVMPKSLVVVVMSFEFELVVVFLKPTDSIPHDKSQPRLTELKKDLSEGKINCTGHRLN